MPLYDSSPAQRPLFMCNTNALFAQRESLLERYADKHSIQYALSRRMYAGGSVDLVFRNYVTSLLAVNPFHAFSFAFSDLIGEKRTHDKFLLDASFNEVVSVLTYGKQFANFRFNKKAPTANKAIVSALDRYSQKLCLSDFDVAVLRDTFFSSTLIQAEYLCKRMTVFLACHEIHPLALVCLSILIVLKSGSCEFFIRGVRQYFDDLFACSSRVEGDAAAKTRALLDAIKTNIQQYELAILTRLNFNVYIVCPEEYVFSGLYNRVVAALGICPPNDADGDSEDLTLLDTARKESMFFLRILRPTDASLLVPPEVIAAFAMTEGIFLTGLWETLYDRQEAYRLIAAQSALDSDSTLQYLLLLRLCLFYFVNDSVPGVPPQILDTTLETLNTVMPLVGSCMFDLDTYRVFVEDHFDVNVVCHIDGDGAVGV